MTDKILEALEIGLDCARSAAEEFHQKFVGYKAEEHKVVDDDVRKIEAAIELYKEQQTKDDWVPWGGGECPVDDSTEIGYELRGGSIGTNKPEQLEWHHYANRWDIVAYRVINKR